MCTPRLHPLFFAFFLFFADVPDKLCIFTRRTEDMGTLEHILDLRRQLNEHNRKYYVDNAPDISDFEFDRLMRELQDLEAAHPEYADPNARRSS